MTNINTNDGYWIVTSDVVLINLSGPINNNTTYLLNVQHFSGYNYYPNLLLDASSGTDDTVQLVGSGSVSVTRNNDGQITISGTDTNTDTNTTYLLKATRQSNGGNSGNDTDPYLFLDASSGTDDSVRLVGSGVVSITRNNDGQITIDAPTIAGTKGQKGDTGTGVKGAKGEVGVGNKGEKGQKGIDGADNSTKGQKGEKGQKGQKGQKGETGQKGQKGEKGQKGDAGMDTSSQSSSYTLQASDEQELLLHSSNITIPPNVFSVADAVTIHNTSSVTRNVNRGSGVTLYMAGVLYNQNRKIAARGIATIVCVASNTFVISGGGVS